MADDTASDETTDETTDEASDVGDELASVDPIDFRDYPADRFNELKDAAQRNFSSANLAERVDAAIDLASLYTSRTLFKEAHSFIDFAMGQAISKEQMEKAKLLRDVNAVLAFDRRHVALIVGEGHITNSSYFTILHHATSVLRTGKLVEGEPLHLDELDLFAPSHKSLLLPVLLEGAVNSKNWEEADHVADIWERHEIAENNPAFHFLLGLSAELAGNELAAFDAWAKAALGKGEYAHKSTIALVKQGMRLNSLKHEDVIDILSTTRNQWRGDHLEAETLRVMADSFKREQAYPEYLLVIGELTRKFSGILEEDERTSLHNEMALIYEKGLSGEIGLDAFHDAHQIAFLSFSASDDYLTISEKYADRLAILGGNAAAAREYRRLLEVVEARELADAAKATGPVLRRDALYNRLLLKKVQAELTASMFDHALDSIRMARTLSDANPDFEFLHAQARAHLGLGHLEAAREVAMKSDQPELRSIVAETLWRERAFEQATETLHALMTDYPGHIGGHEIARLIIASHVSGKPEVTRQAVEAYPDKIASDDPDWKAVARGFSAEKREIERLHKKHTAAVLGDSDVTAKEVMSAVAPDSAESKPGNSN